MKTIGVALLTAGAFMTAAPAASAVELVNMDGKPVGGKFQKWADQAKVPTVRKLVLDISVQDADSECGGADACSSGSLPGQVRFTIVTPNVGRYDFYYELGHQFDWQVLNPSERQWLARDWGQPRAAWSDSQVSVDIGSEDGLEADFPHVYQDCAAGINDQGEDMAVGFISKDPKYAPPGITPRSNECKWLAKIGLHRAGSMRAHRAWTWRLATKEIATTTIAG